MTTALRTNPPCSNLNVTFQFRDPRAIISSMLSQPRAWRAYWQDGGQGTAVCRNMETNLIQLDQLLRTKQLHRSNFIEINYDQWMENVWAGIVRLFSFLDIELTPDLVADIETHFADNSSRRGYLSTFRGASHDKDSWRTKLDNETLRSVRRKCRNLLYDDDNENTELEDSDNTKSNI